MTGRQRWCAFGAFVSGIAAGSNLQLAAINESAGYAAVSAVLAVASWMWLRRLADVD